MVQSTLTWHLYLNGSMSFTEASVCAIFFFKFPMSSSNWKEKEQKIYNKIILGKKYLFFSSLSAQ